MTFGIVFSNLCNILASALGAGIGGFLALKIAVYQIKVGEKTELEKIINPFFFEMKLQFGKAKKIQDEIAKLKLKRVKNGDWEKACINIIKDEKYRIDDPYPNWIKVRSEIYIYFYSKNASDLIFQIVEELVLKFRYLSKAQNDAEKYIEEDVTCVWIEDEYKRIVDIIEKIPDVNIKEKFFRTMSD